MPLLRRKKATKKTAKRATKKATKRRASGDAMRVVERGGKLRTIEGKENQQEYLDNREYEGACAAQEYIAKANQFLLKANFALQDLVLSDLKTRYDYDDLSMTIADFRFGISEQAFDVLESRCNSLYQSKRSKKRAKVRRRK